MSKIDSGNVGQPKPTQVNKPVTRTQAPKTSSITESKTAAPPPASVQLKAKKLADLRGTEPKQESTTEGKETLKQQAGIAGKVLGGAVSMGALLKTPLKLDSKKEKPISQSLTPPPLTNNAPTVDWDSVKPGDVIPPRNEGEPGWVAVGEGESLRLERAGPEANDGGQNWTEVFERRNCLPHQERTVAADDGQGDWTETRQNENMPGVKTRQVPDPNGGPAWTETQYGFGPSIKSRQVEDPEGGNPWTETLNSQTGGITRQRTEPHEQGGVAWNVSVDENGVEFRQREYYDENGIRWIECKSGTNHWRNNVDARQRTIEAGPNHVLTMPGPNGQNLDIQVHGASPEELERVRAHLEALPPEMRASTGVIVIADDIGQFLNERGEVVGNVAGFGGHGVITLDRDSVANDGGMSHVLYHEMGHVQDYGRNPRISSAPPWGDGHAVSPYGRNNREEDYAEAHRVALQNVDHFKGMSREAILAGYPNGHRVVQILDSYNFQYGSGTEVPPIPELGSPSPPPMGGNLGDLMKKMMEQMEQQHQQGQGIFGGFQGGFGNSHQIGFEP